MKKAEKFIATLNDQQKQKLAWIIKYESCSLWGLQLFIGSNLAANIAIRRAVRKYKSLLDLESKIHI